MWFLGWVSQRCQQNFLEKNIFFKCPSSTGLCLASLLHGSVCPGTGCHASTVDVAGSMSVRQHQVSLPLPLLKLQLRGHQQARPDTTDPGACLLYSENLVPCLVSGTWGCLSSLLSLPSTLLASCCPWELYSYSSSFVLNFFLLCTLSPGTYFLDFSLTSRQLRHNIHSLVPCNSWLACWRAA